MDFATSSDPALAPLADWFEAVRRRLPWRAEDLDQPHPDPYAVLVSELMLQQTQVVTVIPYFERWMQRLPDIQSLASASDEEIHRLWEGLGYYRRARFLKRAAEAIAKRGWPQDREGLLELPGIGPYTAAALASIAFQRPEPALDGNAYRVLARLLGVLEDPRTRAPELGAWLRPALSAFGPSRITQAVMELGATCCTPRPRCVDCPLTTVCEAHQRALTDCIPAQRTRMAAVETDLWLVALHTRTHWFVLPPQAKGLLAGLWRWPALPPEDEGEVDRAADRTLAYGAPGIRCWKGWTQVYSHRRETISPIALEVNACAEAAHGCWVDARQLATLPMGKRDQRLRGLLGAAGTASRELDATRLVQRVLAARP